MWNSVFKFTIDWDKVESLEDLKNILKVIKPCLTPEEEYTHEQYLSIEKYLTKTKK